MSTRVGGKGYTYRGECRGCDVGRMVITCTITPRSVTEWPWNRRIAAMSGGLCSYVFGGRRRIPAVHLTRTLNCQPDKWVATSL